MTVFTNFFLWYSKQWNAGTLGKLKIISIWSAIALVGVIALGTHEAGKVTIEVSDGRAFIHKTISNLDSVDGVASDVLALVFRTSQNPAIQQIEITFVMDPFGVTDKYGNPANTFEMGRISWDLDSILEARKYTEANFYKNDEVRRAVHVHQIRSMRGGDLLN